MAPKSKVNPELDEVLCRPENLYCADCGAKAPRWASVNLGILMCIECSGAHRNLGTHISVVKSTTLDKWQPKWIETVTKIGNRIGNDYYEHNLPKSQKLKEGENGQKIANWIRSKYEKREWAPRGRAAPGELLAKGLNPDYEGDPSPKEQPARREGRGRDDYDDSDRRRPDTKDRRDRDRPQARPRDPPKAAATPKPVQEVDLLGGFGAEESFTAPTPAAAPTPAPSAGGMMWTAEFQQASNVAPVQQSTQPFQAQMQQQPQMQQQFAPQNQMTQMYAQQPQMQPPMPSVDNMQNSKVDSLKNALGSLYQQPAEQKPDARFSALSGMANAAPNMPQMCPPQQPQDRWAALSGGGAPCGGCGMMGGMGQPQQPQMPFGAPQMQMGMGGMGGACNGQAGMGMGMGMGMPNGMFGANNGMGVAGSGQQAWGMPQGQQQQGPQMMMQNQQQQQPPPFGQFGGGMGLPQTQQQMGSTMMGMGNSQPMGGGCTTSPSGSGLMQQVVDSLSVGGVSSSAPSGGGPKYAGSAPAGHSSTSFDIDAFSAFSGQPDACVAMA